MPRTHVNQKTSTSFPYQRQSPLAPPIPHTPNPPPQTVQIQPPGFLSSVLQGFGLGTGSAIAHNMFDNTKTVIHKEEPKYSGPCAKEKEVFDKCIQHRQSVEECERILKDLHACYDSNPK